MSRKDEQELEKAREAFERTLNEHGYGFQHSVLKKAGELYDQKRSSWYFVATEFPVGLQGPGTRLDFILRRKEGVPFYILAECKRANPAYSTWCFVKSPYRYRNDFEDHYVIEQLSKYPSTNLNTSGKKLSLAQNAYHISVEVKSDRKGNAAGHSNQGQIEEACSQLSRGLNGIVEFFATHPQAMEHSPESFLREAKVFLLPVIFTTAELWATNVDLSLASLEDGNITIPSGSLKQHSWLVYQYHQSPGLKHKMAQVGDASDLGGIMEQEYVRSIPIVSSSGIEEFLRWISHFDLD